MITSAMIANHGSFSCFISGFRLPYIVYLPFSVHQKIGMHQLKNKTKQESQTGLNRLPENQNQQYTVKREIFAGFLFSRFRGLYTESRK